MWTSLDQNFEGRDPNQVNSTKVEEALHPSFKGSGFLADLILRP